MNATQAVPAEPTTDLSKSASVFVVEDNEGCRQAISTLLSTEGWVVKTYPAAEDFLASLDGNSLGCVVVDFEMPGMNGLDLLKTVRKRGVPIPFIVVSGKCTVPITVDFMKLGVVTVMEKPFFTSELLREVRQAVECDCGRDLSEATKKQIMARISRLTPRELTVFRCIRTGMISRQVAKELGISSKTVEVHRAAIVRKLECESMIQILQYVVGESI